MATNTLTNVNQRLLAKELNVSVGTVSKALRDYPDVGIKTKTKVVELAKKLGYRAYLSDFQYEDVRSEVKFVGVLTQTPQRNYTQIEYLHGMSEISSELNVSQFVHNYTADKCGDILISSLQPPVMREGLMSGLIFRKNIIAFRLCTTIQTLASLMWAWIIPAPSQCSSTISIGSGIET